MAAKLHLRTRTDATNELLNFSHTQTAISFAWEHPRRMTARFLLSLERLLRFSISRRVQVFKNANSWRRQRHDVYMTVLGELARNRPKCLVQIQIFPSHRRDFGVPLCRDQPQFQKA